MPTVHGPDDLTLHYEEAGVGHPVLLIHGAFITDTYRPLLEAPELADGYHLVTYARRGYTGSTPTTETTTVEGQSGDAQTLLDDLGIDQAHVIGHSYGGCVALQLALDAPDAVCTLSLLEPALMVGDSAPGYRASLEEACQRSREQGAAEALDDGLEARWPGYKDPLEARVPGAFDQAVRDAEAAFEHELPGLLTWSFGQEEARRIDPPTLSVLGGWSEELWDRFGQTHEALLAWLPDVEGVVLPGVAHFPQVEDPEGLADALTSFWAKHPIEGR